jgi:hypothetical protein
MSGFTREQRYVVLKVKDIRAYLSDDQIGALQKAGEAIEAGREIDGKAPFRAVVVEQDWPEFVDTWAAIEARDPRGCCYARTTAEQEVRTCGRARVAVDGAIAILTPVRDCCGTFPGSHHRSTCPKYRGKFKPK